MGCSEVLMFNIILFFKNLCVSGLYGVNFDVSVLSELDYNFSMITVNNALYSMRLNLKIFPYIVIPLLTSHNVVLCH